MRLLTYNIQALAAGVDGVLGVVRRLRPDLLALQEVDRGTRRCPHPRPLAPLLGPYGEVFAAAMPYDGGEYGLAVLAAGAVERLEVLRLPRQGGEEPRIAVRCRCALPQGEVELVNTHLAADFGAADPPALRLLQARALRDWLGSLPAGPPRFLLGDLNCAPGSPPHGALCEVAEPLHGALPTYPARAPQEAIDHIFYVPGGGGARPVVIGVGVEEEPAASDHRPLWVELA